MNEEHPQPDPDLERRLDAAFAGLRPRHGFEQALWARIQGRRPWWRRLEGGRTVRALAPALGVLLVVAGGGAVLLTRAQHPGGTFSSSSAPGAPAPADRAGAGLPVPALLAPQGQAPQPGDAAAAPAAYSGPFTVRWAGAAPAAPGSAPVYRYPDPTAAAADAFAAALGAHPGARQAAPPLAGTYDGPGFTLFLVHAQPEQRSEARFVLTPAGVSTAPPPPDDATALRGAAEFLAVHALPGAGGVPTVERTGGTPSVFYPRSLPGGSRDLPVWTASGHPDGLRLFMAREGRVLQAEGPVGGQQPIGSYPLRAPAAAIGRATATSVAGAPELVLDSLRLVYLPVPQGAGGVLEPVYLFSGTATRDGRTQVRLLVVPALAAVG